MILHEKPDNLNIVSPLIDDNRRAIDLVVFFGFLRLGSQTLVLLIGKPSLDLAWLRSFSSHPQAYKACPYDHVPYSAWRSIDQISQLLFALSIQNTACLKKSSIILFSLLCHVRRGIWTSRTRFVETIVCWLQVFGFVLADCAIGSYTLSESGAWRVICVHCKRSERKEGKSKQKYPISLCRS